MCFSAKNQIFTELYKTGQGGLDFKTSLNKNRQTCAFNQNLFLNEMSKFVTLQSEVE